jgi:hypothetical protein
MADEEATADITADESVTNDEVSVSEDVSTDETENTTKGDLRVPLRQTREELRQLREQLDDPNFIYERAKGLGLAAEEDLTPQQPEFQMPNVREEVKTQFEIEKTFEKYPELRTDEELRFMVSGLINKGLSPLQAADKTFAKIKAANEKAAKEAAEAEKKVVKTQEAAQTISSTSEVTSDNADYERIYKETKSRDPRIQKKALIELEKLKMSRGK